MVIQQFNRLIRNKWVWGVFAVAISVFFAFDFLFTGGSPEASSDGAGKLGDKDVSYREFSTLVGDVRGIGRNSDSKLSNAEANRLAWEKAAALEVAKSMKMYASDSDVREVIRRDRSFQGEGGVFNMRMYELLLRENGLTPAMFEAYMKRNLTVSKLQQSVVSSALWVSPMELNGAVNDFTDKFTVRIARFTNKDASKVKLDDKMLETYYKENTNSIALPDCVTIRYVKYQADTPARLAQFNITEDEMRDHYDATSARFETEVKTTNGTETVTKKFEEVKDILKRELQLIASLEAYRTNLLFRVYPADINSGEKVDRIAKIAGEDKAKVMTSPRFALSGGRHVAGFMSRTSAFAPGVSGMAAAVAELDPESADLRYGVVAGTNAVYLIERKDFIKAHVPTFAEAKNVIRGDALRDAQRKAFKASVEKTRALAAADLAKGKPFDAKMFAGANVSTSITFAVSSLQRNSFADSMHIAGPVMKLEKGQISDFIETGLQNQALVVYVENRQPGDAAQAQMVRAQLRDDLSRFAAGEIAEKWMSWNLDRIGFTANAQASTEQEVGDEDLLSED